MWSNERQDRQDEERRLEQLNLNAASMRRSQPALRRESSVIALASCCDAGIKVLVPY